MLYRFMIPHTNRLYILGLLLCLQLLASSARAEPDAAPVKANMAVVAVDEARTLNYTDAVILGLVEGITEYLPISSTGHLILTNALLGLNSDAPAIDREGQVIYLEAPSVENPAGEVFTMKAAADGFTIIIQAGAIAAVALLYWRRLLGVAMGFLGKDRAGLLLGRNLLVAFLPAVVFGLLLDELIERWLFDVWPVVVALAVGGVAMLGVERWRKRKVQGNAAAADGPDIHELSIRQALIIGLLQCVAMWPGTSRSMMTIVGGYLVGLSPVRAAEFSFLLGLITLTAAAGYKSLKVGLPILDAYGLGPVLVGSLVAMVAAALAVKWLVSFLSKHGLALFGWYRIVLAGVVLLFL